MGRLLPPRVSGKIDEDVDLVRLDHVEHSLDRHAVGEAPVGHERLEVKRHRVWSDQMGIGVHLELAGVMLLEKGLDEVSDGVGLEVGRGVANPQLARAPGPTFGRPAKILYHRLRHLAPGEMFRRDPLGWNAWQVITDQQQVAERLQVRAQREAPLETVVRRLRLALLDVDPT